MEYILKSSVALSIAYLLYYLFVSKSFNFKWLRVYFLVALVASLTLPALKYLPNYHQKDIISVPSAYIPAWIDNPNVLVVPVYSSSTPVIKTGQNIISVYKVVTIAYMVGFSVFLLRFIISLFYLTWLTIKYKVKKSGKYYLVLVDNLSTPFSFFHFIFINRNDMSDPRKAMMLQHEKVHIRQWHSVDLILLEIIIMVQWVNPFAWFFRRELKEFHEFLADRGTLKEQTSTLDYQHLLLSQVCGAPGYLLVNGFNNSLTKKRILMITNNKQNRKWFAVLVLLVFTIALTDIFSRIGILKATSNPMIEKVLYIFTPQEKNQVITMKYNQADQKDNANKKSTQNCDVKYDTVASPIKNDSTHKTIIVTSESGSIGMDQSFSSPPMFNGTTCFEESEKDYHKFIQENLKFPAELKDKEITGRVHIIYNVSETGKVSNVRCGNDSLRTFYDEKYKDQPDRLERIRQETSDLNDDPYLIAEAIRVMSLQPDYTPAKNKEGKAVKSYSARDIVFISPKTAKQNELYHSYIMENLKYPQEAIERKAEGTVYLSYDLNKDGKYGNIRLANDYVRNFYAKNGHSERSKNITDDLALINEAIRLLKERPGFYIEKFDTTQRASTGMCNIDFELPKNK